MAYKHIVFVMLLFPFVVIASDDLKNNLASDYQNFTKKVELCSSLNDRELKISNKWFLSLKKVEKGTILLWLRSTALNRCSAQEKDQYVNTLVEYVVRTGVKTPLDEWISSRAYDYINKEAARTLGKLDQKKLKELSATSSVYYPFDLKAALNTYAK